MAAGWAFSDMIVRGDDPAHHGGPGKRRHVAAGSTGPPLVVIVGSRTVATWPTNPFLAVPFEPRRAVPGTT